MNYLIKSVQGQPIQMAINSCIAARERLSLTLHINGSEDTDEYRLIIQQALSTGDPFDLILCAENNDEASSHSTEMAHYLGYSMERRYAFGSNIPEDCNIILIANADLHRDIINDGTVRTKSFLIDLTEEPADMDHLITLIDAGLNNSYLNYPSNRKLIVCAYQLCDDDDLCEEDQSVHGIYQCPIEEPMAQEVACEMALESFHTCIPISSLEDFDIRVFDLHSKTELVGARDPINNLNVNLNVNVIELKKRPVPDWVKRFYGEAEQALDLNDDTPSP
jgi:hypothetical protein